jgi:hypothetical protein
LKYCLITGIDFISQLLERDPAERMTLTEGLRHPWLWNLGQDALPAQYAGDERWLRDTTAGLVDTPRLDRLGSSMHSADDFSQPMRGLNLQTPARMPHDRRNFFSLDSSQGRLAGQSSAFDSDFAMGEPQDMSPMRPSSDAMDCEPDGMTAALVGPPSHLSSREPDEIEAFSDEDGQLARMGQEDPIGESVLDPRSRSQQNGNPVDAIDGSQFPTSVPDTQAQAQSSHTTPIPAESVGDKSSALSEQDEEHDEQQHDGGMKVEVEVPDNDLALPGPILNGKGKERAEPPQDDASEDRSRAESSPLSSLPSSEPSFSPVAVTKSNGKGTRHKASEHLTIDIGNQPGGSHAAETNNTTISTPDTPRGGRMTTMTTERNLRTRTTTHPPTKQKAREEIESPRPKKRAATVGTRSVFAATTTLPASTVLAEDVKTNINNDTRLAGTRSSARLRKR